MAVKDEIAQIRKRMEKAIEDIRKELSSIRTGRASISILDNIQVDYYGVPTPINQVAQLATPEPTMVTVQPYDVSLVGPIDKAISASDLAASHRRASQTIRQTRSHRS
jgi:ribosome recycling factor